MAGAARFVNLRARPLHGALWVLAYGACVACSHSRPAAAPAPPALDASYDWHGLVRIPFQTLLKESAVPLHEVLLFQEEPPATDVENKDCFTVDGTPPRFVGRATDNYLLCFDHDRLNRIEASVRLSAGEAPTVLARACALWSKNAPPGGGLCEGHDGNVAYSARLSLVTGEAAGTLSITLLDVAPRP